MEKRPHKSQWPDERKCYTRNEEEIYSISYEDNLDQCPVSDISSFIKIPHRVDSSKENVELSLEVEIADSLKHLIASPERNESALLDVTIVRPTDLECVPGLEASNTLAFRSSEVRNLLASMERQKQQKKKLIEECKKRVACSKMNPINESREMKNTHSSKELLSKKEERGLLSHKRRMKRNENVRCTRNNIAVMSAPTKTNPQADYNLDKTRNILTTEALDYKTGNPYNNSSPITILKPLVGEIRKSLRNLEASIGQVGDNHSKESRLKRQTKRYSSSSSKTNLSNDYLQYNQERKRHMTETNKADHSNTHQVYASANTYDKLRNLLACQNSERREQQNDEKPCMCQHCGMVGLLVDSQKRPVVSNVPAKKTDILWPRNEDHKPNKKSDNEFLRFSHKDMPKGRHVEDLKIKLNDNNCWIIRELSSRLEALEVRVAEQEQRAVPRDYFKRIINKLWHRQNSTSQQIIRTSTHLKDHSTQYSLESCEVLKIRREPKLFKRRNVQIQQNTKKNYCVNPILIMQTDSEPPTPSVESQESQDRESNKNIGNKALSAISDFFTKKPEINKKRVGTDAPKEKLSAIETFCRWGEEIVKPGFDLKTKILCLLDEQFQNIKHSKETDQKNLPSKKSEPKISLQKEKSLKNNTAAELTPSEVPRTHEDKEISQKEQNISEKKTTFTASSSGALNKMLDLMSEKIYNDHVKPTVEAIKQEQKSLNNENTKHIYSMKAVMDAALYKMNSKNTPRHTTEPVISGKGQEWRKDVFEPLGIPSSFNRNTSHISKLLQKSAIPVRVSNASPTDSTVSGNKIFRKNKKSLIPRLKSPATDYSDYIKPFPDNSSYVAVKHLKDPLKTQKREKHENLHKKTTIEKQDARHVTDSPKIKKNTKPIQIKYMNPKAGYWNEDSCASLQAQTSEEYNQVMLTNKPSRSSSKDETIREDKRQISHKQSIADKLAFLTNITKTEMGKAHIWSNILKQAQNHCRSKQDTVIIQVPTKTHYKNNGTGITEVEFTIEDIQKLVNNSKLASSTDVNPQEAIGTDNMDSFLLIRNRKILQEVHKRLGK